MAQQFGQRIIIVALKIYPLRAMDAQRQFDFRMIGFMVVPLLSALVDRWVGLL